MVLGLGASVGCSAEVGEPQVASHEDKIARYLELRGFDINQLAFHEQGVTVEGDIFFSKEILAQAIAEAEAQAVDFSHSAEEIRKGYWYRTTATPLPVQTFSLCLDNNLSGQPLTSFRRAAKIWSQATFDGAKLAFNIIDGDCSGFASNEIITVSFGTPPSGITAWAEASWPVTSGGVTGPGPTITVNNSTAPGAATFSLENATQQLKIAIHEIGHCLGFAHPGTGNHVSGTANNSTTPSYLTVMRQGPTEIDHLEEDDLLTASKFYEGVDFGCDAFDPNDPDTAFCSAACPCTVGEGDCDGDSQCAYGLECATDRGAEYGLPSNYEVCLKPASCPALNVASPNTAFCGNHGDCPCGVGEGDCDSDYECGGSLVCGTNNGAAVGLPSNYEVCKLPPRPGCPTFDLDNLSTSFCSSTCPCSLGEGDCDTDADCQADHVCAQNVGADFGMPADWDVCVKPGVF
jgi:hypothetical protein